MNFNVKWMLVVLLTLIMYPVLAVAIAEIATNARTSRRANTVYTVADLNSLISTEKMLTYACYDVGFQFGRLAGAKESGISINADAEKLLSHPPKGCMRANP